MLLDDLFSELDPERSERALALLADRGQVLVTTADPDAIPPARRARVPVLGTSTTAVSRSRRESHSTMSREESGAALQRALLGCIGPGAAA